MLFDATSVCKGMAILAGKNSRNLVLENKKKEEWYQKKNSTQSEGCCCCKWVIVVVTMARACVRASYGTSCWFFSLGISRASQTSSELRFCFFFASFSRWRRRSMRCNDNCWKSNTDNRYKTLNATLTSASSFDFGFVHRHSLKSSHFSEQSFFSP